MQVLKIIIVVLLAAITYQFFALMQNLNTLRAIESEQRDALWCIHDGNCNQK